MKKNVGNPDRIVRLVAAALFGILYFTGTVTGTFGVIALVLAGILVVTSLVSFCPLYALIGLNSCPVKK